jgi:hypothetical protein
MPTASHNRARQSSSRLDNKPKISEIVSSGSDDFLRFCYQPRATFLTLETKTSAPYHSSIVLACPFLKGIGPKHLRMEYHNTSHTPFGPRLDHPPVAGLIHPDLDLVAPKKHVGLHKLPSGFRLRTEILPPLFVLALNGAERPVEVLASREIGSAAPDVQAQEVAAQSGFSVRGELGGVDVDGEG